MHYHDLFNLTFKPELKDAPIQTGYYEFYHEGGLFTGNVIRVGEKVVVKTLTIGIVEIDTLKFIASNPVKL